MGILEFIKPKTQDKVAGQALSHGDDKEEMKKCPICSKESPISSLEINKMVCECGYHFRIGARKRIAMITDKGTFTELFSSLKTDDPIDFPGYKDKMNAAHIGSGENDAIICGTASIDAHPCCIFAMEPAFMMGSMGSVVGEKITRLFEYALDKRLPVIGYTVSGGARMQEGLISLMQMAKTSAAIKKHSDAGLLYVAILTDPTMGGVTASFAMEADIILAEPGATIGFAGARVIEQTMRKPLPKGFQKAELVLQHGFIDKIVSRDNQQKTLRRILRIHSGGWNHADAI